MAQRPGQSETCPMPPAPEDFLHDDRVAWGEPYLAARHTLDASDDVRRGGEAHWLTRHPDAVCFGVDDGNIVAAFSSRAAGVEWLTDLVDEIVEIAGDVPESQVR